IIDMDKDKPDAYMWMTKNNQESNFVYSLDEKNVREKVIDLKQFIEDKYNQDLDILFIEGAGGLLTPYSDHTTQLDLIKALQIPVLLVSAIKVGCINHTLLTINELNRHNIKLAGWIANCNDSNIKYIDEQINTIEELSGYKCSAKISRNADYLDFIDLSKILI
ncbi:ATP-dependent dethiobiotin synthetase BioD, partial [Francisella tularensis]|uniref:ATP-dependent dethiobiotin synthetase BioD n=1 Tax=Francisella tularensis TaxID=263 RepID=UPI001F165BF0